jgi:hypothetical protein
MFVLSSLQLLLVVKYLVKQCMEEKQPNIVDNVEFEPYFTPCTRSATVDYGLRGMRRTKMKFDHRGLTTAPIQLESDCIYRETYRLEAMQPSEVAAEYLRQDPNVPRANIDKNQFVNKYTPSPTRHYFTQVCKERKFPVTRGIQYWHFWTSIYPFHNSLLTVQYGLYDAYPVVYCGTDMKTAPVHRPNLPRNLNRGPKPRKSGAKGS